MEDGDSVSDPSDLSSGTIWLEKRFTFNYIGRSLKWHVQKVF